MPDINGREGLIEYCLLPSTNSSLDSPDTERIQDPIIHVDGSDRESLQHASPTIDDWIPLPLPPPRVLVDGCDRENLRRSRPITDDRIPRPLPLPRIHVDGCDKEVLERSRPTADDSFPLPISPPRISRLYTTSQPSLVELTEGEFGAFVNSRDANSTSAPYLSVAFTNITAGNTSSMASSTSPSSAPLPHHHFRGPLKSPIE